MLDGVDAAFVTAVDSLPVKANDLGWVALQGRAANAERQLGRFDAASKRMAAVDRSIFEPPAGGGDPQEARNRSGWKAYYEDLAVVIARRETSRDPLDMIEDRVAAYKCKAMADRSKAQPAGFCEQPEIAKLIAGAKD